MPTPEPVVSRYNACWRWSIQVTVLALGSSLYLVSASSTVVSVEESFSQLLFMLSIYLAPLVEFTSPDSVNLYRSSSSYIMVS